MLITLTMSMKIAIININTNNWYSTTFTILLQCVNVITLLDNLVLCNQFDSCACVTIRYYL